MRVISSSKQVSRLRSEQRESPIQCVFLCEFHPTAGPKISFQVPEDYVSKENFDALNVYLIPKTELQGRLITINALGLKIIGFPVGINNQKYARNRLIFNLCFVCVASMRTMQYESLVRKLASYLIHLEMECGFLSNEKWRLQLPEFLSKIKDQLTTSRVCSIPVTHSTTVHLKVVSVQPDPQQCYDHHVPIFVTNEASIIPNQWDLTTQQILPFIDGYRHIAKIAAEADVEVSLVKACIQNMIYYGIIMLIPIFQYSNVYCTTPVLAELIENSSLQEECIRFVTKIENQLPTFRSIFQLYCSMNPSLTVRDLCMKFNPNASGIDERKLIKFGLMKGLIRRLQKYPIFLAPEPHSVANQRGLFKWFSGDHSYDEICSKNMKSFHELEDKVEKHPAVVVCWK